jgi:hypothetical protein
MTHVIQHVLFEDLIPNHSWRRAWYLKILHWWRPA